MFIYVKNQLTLGTKEKGSSKSFEKEKNAGKKCTNLDDISYFQLKTKKGEWHGIVVSIIDCHS